MKETLRIAAVLAMFASAPSWGGALEDGRDLESAGKLAEARAKYEECLKADPDDRQAKLRLAHVLVDSLALKDAESLVSSELARFPEDAPLLNELGRLRFHQGRMAEAVDAFKASSDRDPKFPDAIYNLGISLQSMGKDRAARAAFRRALEVNPKFVRALNGLAVLEVREKNVEEALRLLHEAERVEPRDYETRYNLGVVFSETDKLDEAGDNFRRALDARPDSGEARNNYGRVLMKQGRNRDAERELREAIRLAPGLAEPRLNLGVLLDGEKRLAEAKVEFQKALELDPKQAEAAFRLGAMELGVVQQAVQGKDSKAMDESILRARDYFEAAVKASPDYTEARYNLTLTLLQMRQLDRAALHAAELVKRDPGTPQNQFLLGTIEVQRGRVKTAETAYRTAIKLDPKCLDCRIRLGSLLSQVGKFRPAQEAFQEALKLDDKNVEATFLMGMAHMRQGEFSKARTAMLRTLELAPDHLDAINNAAQIALRLKDTRQAADMIGRAVEKDPAYLPIFRTAEMLYAQSSSIDVIGTPRIVRLLTGYMLGYRAFFRDYRKSRAEFVKLTQEEPRLAAAWLKIGILDVLNGKNRQGLEALQKAEELAPNDTEMYYAIGTAWYNLGEKDSRGARSPHWGQALNGYRKAVAAAPLNAEAYWGEGSVLYMMGRYKEARSALGTCLKLNPFFAEAYNTFGSVAAREADLAQTREEKDKFFTEASQMFRQALRANPNSETAHYNLGVIYQSLRKYDEAIAEYEIALRLNPKFELAWYKLARSYGERRGWFDKGRAEETFQKLAEIAPDNCEYAYDFGAFYFNARKYEKAKAQWRAVLARCPDHKPARDGIDRLIERGY